MAVKKRTPLKWKLSEAYGSAVTVDSYPTESQRINQALRLCSATRYYLKRYRDDLQPHAEGGNDDALIMVTMCTALLDSADMLEGVTDDR